jgi:hypothetical protein
VSGVTAMALAAVLFSGVDDVVKAILLTGILFSGGYWIADRGLRLMPFSIVRAVFMRDAECVLVDRRGRARSFEVKDGMNLGRFVAIVTLRDDGWRSPVLCLSVDGVNPEVFRRVRMRTRMLPTQPSVVHALLRHGLAIRNSRNKVMGEIEP